MFIMQTLIQYSTAIEEISYEESSKTMKSRYRTNGAGFSSYYYKDVSKDEMERVIEGKRNGSIGSTHYHEIRGSNDNPIKPVS